MHSDFVYYSLDDFEATDNVLPQGCNVIREKPVPFVYQARKRELADFIILVEFSEIEGPAPVFTIPAQPMADVELDEFVIQLMSTDYQVNQIGEFQLCQDSKVMRTNICNDVSAYLQYFTLLDTQARGFVRPFCLAYVTKDRIKLERFFVEFVGNFSQVTRILKHANRKWFTEEVGKILRNLQQIKGNYILWKQNGAMSAEENKENNAFLENEFANKRINLSQIAQQYSELENVMYKVSETLGDELCELTLGHWRSAAQKKQHCLLHQLVNCEVMSSTLAQRKVLQIPRSFRVGEEIVPCPFVVLGQWGAVVAAWKLVHLHKHYCQDLCLLLLRGWQPVIPIKMHQFQLASASLVCKNATDESAISELQGIFKIEEALESLELQRLLRNPCSKPASVGTYVNSTDDCMQNGGRIIEVTNAFLSGYGNSVVCSEDSFEEQIHPLPSWEILSCVQKRRPGYGILKFFRTFNKVAHHVLFSLLLGRILIICGDHNCQSLVSDIITALLPFIPLPSGQSGKILRWHHGIIVTMHIKQYKMIGLCVPERLTVHDMMNHRDKNQVTILDVQTRQLFGPAYSGRLLANLANNCQKHYESDETFLAYVYSMMADIEGRVFTYRNCQRASVRLSATRGFHSISKRLELSDGDADFIRYLSTLSSSTEF